MNQFKEWKDWELDIIKNPHIKGSFIQKKMLPHRSLSSIHHKRTKEKIHYLGPFDEKQKIKIINMYKRGVSLYNIAKEFNSNYTAIRDILVKKNVPRDQTERCPEFVSKVIEMYQNGTGTPSIGKELGMSCGNIIDILKKNNIERRDDSESNRKYTFKRDFFDKIDTEEKAWALGLLCADGSVCLKKNGWSIALTDDRDAIEKLVKMLDIRPDPINIQSGRNGTIPSKDSDKISIYYKQHVDALQKWGCIHRKSYNLKFPFPNFLSTELMRHFLRGYLDGDGCIEPTRKKTSKYNFRPRIHFTSTPMFCKGLKQFLEKELKIHSRINKSQDNYSETVTVERKKDVNIILHWMYDRSSVYMNRKYKKYIKFCNYYKKYQQKNREYVKKINNRNNKIIELYNKNISYKKISNELNISTGTVSNVIRKARQQTGVDNSLFSERGKLYNKMYPKVVHLYRSGEIIKNIQSSLKISKHLITTIIKNAVLKRGLQYRRSSFHNKDNLITQYKIKPKKSIRTNNNTRNKIISLHKEDVAISNIAYQCSVGKTTVHRVLKKEKNK